MSVSATGSSALPDPGFYSYPSSAAALSAPATSSSPAAPSSSAASGSSAAPTQISSYQTAYDSLMQQDTSELLEVTFDSAAAADANVDDVLAQAAALQQQQLAAQQQAQTAPPPAITVPTVPSFASVVQQSDGSAGSDLANGTIGASIDTTA